MTAPVSDAWCATATAAAMVRYMRSAPQRQLLLGCRDEAY